MFDFYGTVISPIDGDRCPMYPSCTRYAKESIRKHGALIGWVMAMDRLVRCGRDEKTISRPYFSGNKKWIHDPVENNDFWWVDK
jgi:putative component of membrane protein insertase Oxa1/YidC/SpoIIIJ protein YidD